MTRQSPDKSERFEETHLGQDFFERVAQWLDSNDLEYSDYPDGQFFALRYAGDSGDWRVIVDVGVGANGRRLLIYSIYPVRVPEGRRSAMAERMLAVQLRRIAAMNPLRRPEILPADRFEVLQIIRLQGWSVREAARRFVLHKNTVSAWQRLFRGRRAREAVSELAACPGMRRVELDEFSAGGRDDDARPAAERDRARLAEIRPTCDHPPRLELP